MSPIDWLLREMMRRRTHMLEVYLGMQALVCGLWVLLPGQRAFPPETAVGVIPEAILGVVLVAHGLASLYAVLWTGDVHMCRRAALASAGIWSFLFALLVAAPPATRFTLPLVAMLAGASLWVYFRLYLIWHPPTRRMG